MSKQALKGRVALVAGATRGAGRGIAVELGAIGATVYCTGRSVRANTSGRPETIDETAELVTRAGGRGISMRVDHTVPTEVEDLLQRIDQEQDGKLDIVVNDIWGGDELTQWNVPFWDHDLDNGLKMLERAIDTHIITSHYAAPLLVKRRQGVIFEITDGKTYEYRGTFFYDLVKTTVMRMANPMHITICSETSLLCAADSSNNHQSGLVSPRLSINNAFLTLYSSTKICSAGYISGIRVWFRPLFRA